MRAALSALPSAVDVQKSMHACNVNNRGAARGRVAKSCGMVKKFSLSIDSCNLTSALPINSVRSGSGISETERCGDGSQTQTR